MLGLNKKIILVCFSDVEITTNARNDRNDLEFDNMDLLAINNTLISGILNDTQCSKIRYP